MSARGERGPAAASPVALIAAVARNGAIGARGGLPWRLSSDLKRFKALTMGKALIMGRKTFDSVGRPLPGRDVIVVTRDADWSRAGVRIACGLDEALALAQGADEIMIGGGGEIYRLALARARRLYITEVDLAPEADVRFPPIDAGQWREIRREPGARGPNDEADFAFVQYERR
ncbi:MAG: dihydrofolate reductase [Pseudomonadota bacterium]|nr:dihydrofolate reductase [Pseudomonadota bacterium]